MLKPSRTAALPRSYRTAWMSAPLLLLLLTLLVSRAGADQAMMPQIDLAGCENLAVPANSRIAFHTYAEGVQIYRWNGSSWSFVAPEAVLFADSDGKGIVGTHYAGPTWQSVSGSKVVASVAERCTPNPDAIPWLLLAAVPVDGAGVFQRVTWIQRLNTIGGKAPAEPGSYIDEEVRIPYTAEYFFYQTPTP